MTWCWHEWVVAEKEILPSAFEQLAAAGAEEIEGAHSKYFSKPCIVTLQCGKCGTQKVERI